MPTGTRTRTPVRAVPASHVATLTLTFSRSPLYMTARSATEPDRPHRHAITDDGPHRALRSTRNRLRTAVHHGCVSWRAWRGLGGVPTCNVVAAERLRHPPADHRPQGAPLPRASLAPPAPEPSARRAKHRTARVQHARHLAHPQPTSRGERRLSAHASRSTAPNRKGLLACRNASSRWWAWEDLNLRPHPQVKISARGGKLPGTYQGRRGPRLLRGAVNGPEAVLCCPSSCVRGGRKPWATYQQNTGNRCADRRLPRSRPTVGAEVKCSHSVQLNALLTRSGFIDPTPTLAVSCGKPYSLHRHLPAQTPLHPYLSTLPAPPPHSRTDGARKPQAQRACTGGGHRPEQPPHAAKLPERRQSAHGVSCI
jgi:hypothetical protein